MIHFLRNRLYKNTACGLDKDEVETATTHTMVTCPDCLDYLISWMTDAVEELKKRRAGTPNMKIRRKTNHEQTEIDFDEPVSGT